MRASPGTPSPPLHIHGEVWSAHWLTPESIETPRVFLYQLKFTRSSSTETLRFHVSADERYDLWLDGKRIGRGSERGDRYHWFYETYELTLPPGAHTLVARVWALGDLSPYAQMSCKPGFILAVDSASDEASLSTGYAPWEFMVMQGIRFFQPSDLIDTGARSIIHGSAYPWGWEDGTYEGAWYPATKGHHGNSSLPSHVSSESPLLSPAQLPPQLDRPFHGSTARHLSAPSSAIPSEQLYTLAIASRDDLSTERHSWQRWLNHGRPLTIPPHTRRRLVIDLNTYLCAYPEISVQGGARSHIRLSWAESLFLEPIPGSLGKGQRDVIEGKYFTHGNLNQSGIGTHFYPDGGGTPASPRRFDTLWWECGRYIELFIETDEAPLTLHGFTLRETRYPLEIESSFAASDPRLARFGTLAAHALRMCAHETYFDCPYYEQLMYIGDTRLQALITYATTRDARLPYKAIAMFNASRLPNGLTQSRYPTRLRQVIPPFSLWWVGMVHDYALWRGDIPFLKEHLPGLRSVIETFLLALDSDSGVLNPLPGWNFIDWADGWVRGMPPGSNETDGPSACLNLQLLLALDHLQELETWVGEAALAARLSRRAIALAKAVDSVFWDDARSLWADDTTHRHFSEHAQCLATLAGPLLPADRQQRAMRALLSPEIALTRCTLYFSHYKLEALHRHRLSIVPHLDPWLRLEEQGFTTTPERPEPSRSDCHAWGAHPLYHYYTSLLGIRPSALGFRSVHIAPNPGSLTDLKGSLVHPDGGEIQVHLDKSDDGWRVRVSLPPLLTGTLEWEATLLPLSPGITEKHLPLRSTD